MHEMGIVYHVMGSVEEIAKENHIHHISAVTLQIGQVTGVIFEYMADLWRWASDKSGLLRGSELRQEEIRAVTRCLSCGKTYDTVPQGKICPYCKSPDTVLVTGNEYIIKSIETDDPAEEEASAGD